MNEWKKNLRKITPYVPGEQSKEENVVKLNANESPYPPSPKAAEVIRSFDTDALRLYPHADATPLKAAIAKHYGVKAENVFLGNGSDDVIALAFQALFNSELPIMFPDITYSFYPVWCRLFRIPYETPALDENFRIVPEDYRKKNGGVILPNPNAPTSLGEGEAFIRKMMNYNRDSIVVIDEAYADFGGYSCVALTKEYENLLVTGTFSKSRSLAGLRIGFAIGSGALISVLEAVKNAYNSYTVDALSIAAGIVSVEDETYFRETVEKVICTRTRLTEDLRRLGFTVLDSCANFVFVTRQGDNMKALFEFLKERKVFIRYFDLPRLKNYVRITVGTDAQTEILIKEIKAYLERKN